MAERTVIVWDRPCSVHVHRTAKTVWTAYGRYMDEIVEAKGRSENSALAAWRDVARYRGNG